MLSDSKVRGADICFAELKASVYECICKNYFVAKVGNKHFFDSKKEAINAIYKKLDEDKCTYCEARVFSECQ